MIAEGVGLRVLFLYLILSATGAFAMDARRLAEPLLVNGNRVPYPVFAVYVLPGGPLALTFADGSAGDISFTTLQGPLPSGDIPVPQSPGLYPAEIRNRRTGEQVLLQVFVMTPAGEVDDNGFLNGYRIGHYPEEPFRGHRAYLPPGGLVEVTPENLDTPISPNFTLGQFLCKQDGGFPRYVVLRASLLLKLESILAALNQSGHTVGGFVVMSGYRTPWYNAAIGNGAYSRHVWGGAADIYIDESPADGEMDDLNRDGRVDRGDAEWLADFIHRMSERGDFGPRIGGLGIYDRNHVHGPFVHVDARGFMARW